MKYVLVDADSKAILTFTNDVRVSSNLQRSIFDSEVLTVYPHYDYYENITSNNILKNVITLEDVEGLSLILDEDAPPLIQEKKELAEIKKNLIILLFGITIRKLASHSYFLNQTFPELIKDEKLLLEYCNSREIGREFAEKDLMQRINMYNSTIIKLQACIDDFLELIIQTNVKSELAKIGKMIKERMV
jgi:hypothetical protein